MELKYEAIIDAIRAILFIGVGTYDERGREG